MHRSRFFRVYNGATLVYFRDESCSERARRGEYPLAHARLELDPEDPLMLKLCATNRSRRNTDLVARAETSAQAEEWTWCWFQCTYAAALDS